MQERNNVDKSIKSTFGKIHWRRVFFTLCFLAFCIGEQRVSTTIGRNGLVYVFQDFFAAVVAVICLSHLRLRELIEHKLPYILWTAISAVGVPVGSKIGFAYHEAHNHVIFLACIIAAFGYVWIHIGISMISEKKKTGHVGILGRLHKPFLIPLGVMLLYMLFSRSDYVWPLGYLLSFGALFFTDFSREELQDLYHGAMNGVILSLFVLQAWCCVFRPYDEVRYVGAFANSNMNARYYLEVLAAVLCKLLSAYMEQKKRVLKVFYWLGAGATLSLLFMTIGRTAWCVAALLICLFLAFFNLLMQKTRVIRNAGVLLLCTILTFPLCFGLVRYMPPVFHHPIWLEGEYSEDKVHSWDPWNSEKYVDAQELLDAAVGRVTSLLSPKAKAAESVPGDSPENPILEGDEGTVSSITLRATIYKYYWQHLNWTGHPYSEQGTYALATFFTRHAHNIYLQYGTDFGIPVMLLFLGLMGWSLVSCIRRSIHQRSVVDAYAAMLIFIVGLFGLFEYSWGIGSLPMTMLFVAWRRMAVREVI